MNRIVFRNSRGYADSVFDHFVSSRFPAYGLQCSHHIRKRGTTWLQTTLDRRSLKQAWFPVPLYAREASRERFPSACYFDWFVPNAIRTRSFYRKKIFSLLKFWKKILGRGDFTGSGRKGKHFIFYFWPYWSWVRYLFSDWYLGSVLFREHEACSDRS